MPKGDRNQAVRPLDNDTYQYQLPQRNERRPPQLVFVVMLLAIGGLLGWFVASRSGSDTATTPAATADADRLASLPPPDGPAPDVVWSQATTVPAIPAGWEYGGISSVAEVGGTMYVVVNWFDPGTTEESAQLWSSRDGLEWQAEPIDVGQPVTAYDITAAGNALLLVGRSDGTDQVWRSVPGRAIGGSSWTEIPLDVPPIVDRDVFGAAVSDQGDIVVMMIGYLDIVGDIIGPYLPPDVDLTDDQYTYGGGVIYTTRPATSIRIFAEPPEVVVAGDNVWIRLVTLEGEEILQTVELPAGGYPATADPTLEGIPLLMAWVSSDGVDFQPVLGKNALPRGLFVPEAWEDGFIAAVYELTDSFATGEAVTLWGSQSGRAWSPEELQPPSECSPYVFAISGTRIHLTAEDGTQCIRSTGSEWNVLAEPSTSTYVLGGPAGFIGYPKSFEYDTAIFSRDGLSWAEIEIPGLEPYPTISILDDRLLILSVGRSQPDNTPQIEFWVGEPTD